MEILYFDSIPSTQIYLTEKIREREISSPTAIITEYQTDGIGSRGNRWIGQRGNFFASLALDKEYIPDDLPIVSASLYFAYIMKSILVEYNPNIWIKWPNDIYLGDKKIGGVITQRLKNFYVTGIGINLKRDNSSFEAMEEAPDALELLKSYIELLKERESWSSIFSKYRLEFEKSRKFESHIDNTKVSLKDARILEDGTLEIEGERIVTLR